MLTGEVPFKGENQVAVAMKHVREELPDVQARRPEVSAALASVVDTATAKRVEDRYADDAELIADLEDVLAIETARAGSATGEVTSVLRTLPSNTRARVPFRHPPPGRRRSVLLGARRWSLVAGAIAWVLHRPPRPPRQHPGQPARPAAGATPRCACAQSCAHDYNPDAISGRQDPEPGETGNAIDGDLSTAWSTEQYYQPVGANYSLGKPGVGLYVDAHPRVVKARLAGDQHRHAGLRGQRSTPQHARRTRTRCSAGQRQLGLDPSRRSPRRSPALEHPPQRRARYRYYLIWITQLPPGQKSVSLNEVTLYK